MPLRLILSRHAKSSWRNPGIGDHDRPLNRRGRASADALGNWLRRHGYLPGEALVSSSMRTRETWARIADRLPTPPGATILPALYLADPESMLAVLRQASTGTVILIAHNPGTARMAARLATTVPDDPRFQRYPTAATSIIDFAGEAWSTVGWNTGTLTDFVVPRDLLD